MKTPEQQRQRALQLLPVVLGLPKTKRTPELLADFCDGLALGWAVAVGACFRDALDIKRRIAKEVPLDEEAVQDPSQGAASFTQGSQFAFSAGDTLYDTSEAYQRWDVALQQMGLCLQIREARPATPKEEIVVLARKRSFQRTLERRRLDIVRNIPEEPTPLDDVRDRVKKATGKRPTDSVLDKLVTLGILSRDIVEVSPRISGMVAFDILRPDKRRNHLSLIRRETVTQDDFVRLLIEGMSESE